MNAKQLLLHVLKFCEPLLPVFMLYVEVVAPKNYAVAKSVIAYLNKQINNDLQGVVSRGHRNW